MGIFGMRKIFSWLIGLAFLSVLTACGGVSLAEDVTPPPNYQPSSAGVQPAAQESTAYPLLPPDPAQGAAIYQEKCLPCHGATGMGDGPQAGNLPSPPPAIGSVEVARAARPADWFDVVTNGRLEKLMPGFSGSLNDRQRWDVVAYAFSLSRESAAVDKGKTIYDQQCANCHGDQGQGSANAPDWTTQDRLSVLSDAELEGILANGQNSMPAFADKLSSDDRFAVIDYVRTLMLAGTSPAGEQDNQPEPTAVETVVPGEQATPVGTPAAEAGTPAAERSVTIGGSISDSKGGAVGNGLTVTLAGFDGMNQVSENQTTTGPDGKYEFKDVQVKPNMAFMARVEKDSYTFNSDIVHAADITGDTVSLPITVFDTTTDASGLVADRLHLFFDFTQPGEVQVVELFIISNPMGKVVVASAPDKPALTFKFPPEAPNLQFAGGAIGDRFVQTADGFGDLSPVQPDPEQHQVLFSYNLPYDRGLSLEVPVPINVSAAVVMLPPGGIKLQSDQLMAGGSRDVQGMTFQLFTGSNLSAGSTLKIDLSGKANPTAPTTNSSLPGLLIGAGTFGLVLVGAGFWVLRRRKAPMMAEVGAVDEAPIQESEDDLVDAILALDDLHQAGKLPDDAYKVRRAELKEQLRQIREGK